MDRITNCLGCIKMKVSTAIHIYAALIALMLVPSSLLIFAIPYSFVFFMLQDICLIAALFVYALSFFYENNFDTSGPILNQAMQTLTVLELPFWILGCIFYGIKH